MHGCVCGFKVQMLQTTAQNVHGPVDGSQLAGMLRWYLRTCHNLSTVQHGAKRVANAFINQAQRPPEMLCCRWICAGSSWPKEQETRNEQSQHKTLKIGKHWQHFEKQPCIQCITIHHSDSMMALCPFLCLFVLHGFAPRSPSFIASKVHQANFGLSYTIPQLLLNCQRQDTLDNKSKQWKTSAHLHSRD